MAGIDAGCQTRINTGIHGPHGCDTFTSALSDHSIAADFLENNRRELGPIEQGVIDVATTAPYSFHSVMAVAELFRASPVVGSKNS